MSDRAREANPHLLPVWMNVRLVGGIQGLHTQLVEKVWDLMQPHLDEIDPRLKRSFDRATADGLEWLEVRTRTEEFLSQVRKRGLRVVLILDEFDAAREVFRTQPGAFQALRAIAYNPEPNVGLVTTSRRELREIVDMADPVESTFPGIFRSVYLTCFDKEDLTALAARLDSCDGARLVPRLFEMSGGHPYLASHLLDRLWTETQGAVPLPMDVAVRALREPMPPEFQQYYADLQDLMRADGRTEALLEIVLGPQLTATQDDAESLLQQGLIRKSGPGYTAFSDHFMRFLTLLSRELSPWETWNAVENGVRGLVERTFQAKYGEDWPSACRRSHPEIGDIIDRCTEMREYEQRNFGRRASTRLIDFTYPGDLFDLMSSHWGLFAPIMKKNKQYWRERFVLLKKVRNPMAHSRAHSVGAADLKLFDVYCTELLELIKD